MKKLFKTLLIFTIAFIGMSATSASDPTIYFIGDSTMADYDPAVYPNQRGWGQMFQNFLTGNINFVNAARNGRSSRTFYCGSDSLWANVRSALKPGDYVFIDNYQRGKFPKVKVAYTPIPCMHCDDASCVKAAREGEIYKRPDGIVITGVLGDPDSAARLRCRGSRATSTPRTSPAWSRRPAACCWASRPDV